MGLHLCYELHASDADAVPVVLERLASLRARAVGLPFAGVSELVQFTEVELIRPWPLRGLAFERLEDVVDVAARSACYNGLGLALLLRNAVRVAPRRREHAALSRLARRGSRRGT